MRLLVVGAGATGGYFGARLADAGRDVTFLVRHRRAVRLEADGLRVVSPHGNLTVKPRVVTADRLDVTYDAVLLTVKAFALEQALVDVAPAVGVQTMILPVLNGMRHVDQLRERFGGQAVTGCVCKVATTIDDEGRILQIAPVQELAYGELDRSVTKRIAALDTTMQDAGFDARLSDDIELEMWRKWVLLASLGAITCLLGGPIGVGVRAPGGKAFVHSVIDEIAAITAAEGHPVGEAFLSTTKADLSDPDSTQTSSMFREMQVGRPIEADQIIGDLLGRGEKHGFVSPMLRTVYTRLCVYENLRRNDPK